MLYYAMRLDAFFYDVERVMLEKKCLRRYMVLRGLFRKEFTKKIAFVT